MLRNYFKQEALYIQQYGAKTFFFIQCGSFFEVYGLKHRKGEFENERLTTLSRLTGLAIAAKNTHKGTATYKGLDVYMCGFSQINRLDKWVDKLNQEGYTVAVHVQEKDVPSIRKELGVYSPGTNFNNTSGEITNNIMAIWIEQHQQLLLNKSPVVICGIACIDIFTGKAYTFEYKETYLHNPTTFDEIERFYSTYQPTELIVIHNMEENVIDEILQFSSIQNVMLHKICCHDKDHVSHKQVKRCERQTYQQELLEKFYDITDLECFFKSLQLWDYPMATQAFCFLLNFIYAHNPALVRKIKEPLFTNGKDRLMLPNHSLKQLHIISEKGENGRLSSVLSFMNRGKTPMGKRELARNILNPKTDIEWLGREYAIVEYITKNYEQWQNLRKALGHIADFERLYRKIILKNLIPSELASFQGDLIRITTMDKQVQADSPLSSYINIADLSKHSRKVTKAIRKVIVIKEAVSISTMNIERNIFQRGYYQDVDTREEAYLDSLDKMNVIRRVLTELVIYGGKLPRWHTIFISNAANNSKQQNIIKIHKTDKSGMFLTVTARRWNILSKNIQNLPELVGDAWWCDRKLSNLITRIRSTNRYDLHYNSSYDKSKRTLRVDLSAITTSKGPGGCRRLDGCLLTPLYSTIFQQHNHLKEVLKKCYNCFLESLQQYDNEIDIAIRYIATLDSVLTRAFLARTFNYCKPTIDTEAIKPYLRATQIRHVLIEHLQQNELYVPNDISIGENHNGILLYGTNAVGKSSLIRSIGICVILAQAGFFVPCEAFHYRPYHAVFTRILGNDDIFKGLSTFVVEMSELRTILSTADQHSLILGDEVCSGTETSSAVSIFAAALIKLHERQSSFIFATHFHELIQLEQIQNLAHLIILHMAVKYDRSSDILIYDRILKAGAGNSMYGLEVCKALSMPGDFLDLAHNIRRVRTPVEGAILDKKASRYNSSKIKGNCEMCGRLGEDIHHLQPQHDAGKDGFIGQFHKNHKANLSNLCKQCHHKVTQGKIKHRISKTSKGRILHTI